MAGRSLTIVLIAAAGCASGGTSSSNVETPSTMRVGGTSGQNTQMSGVSSSSGDAVAGSVAAPLANVWRILPAVYDSLGIRVATIDPASHTVGNTGFSIRHQLGNTSLSKYIDCGNAQGGRSADTYDIQMSVLTHVVAKDPATTTLSTAIQVVGRPITTAGDWSQCTSTGTLERLITSMVAARLKS